MVADSITFVSTSVMVPDLSALFGFRCLGIESRVADQYDVISDDCYDVTSCVRLSVVELRRQIVMRSI
jgi:hypothetical protein